MKPIISVSLMVFSTGLVLIGAPDSTAIDLSSSSSHGGTNNHRSAAAIPPRNQKREVVVWTGDNEPIFAFTKPRTNNNAIINQSLKDAKGGGGSEGAFFATRTSIYWIDGGRGDNSPTTTTMKQVIIQMVNFTESGSDNESSPPQPLVVENRSDITYFQVSESGQRIYLCVRLRCLGYLLPSAVGKTNQQQQQPVISTYETVDTVTNLNTSLPYAFFRSETRNRLLTAGFLIPFDDKPPKYGIRLEEGENKTAEPPVIESERNPLDNQELVQDLFGYARNGFEYVLRNFYRTKSENDIRRHGSRVKRIWIIQLVQICANDSGHENSGIKSTIKIQLKCGPPKSRAVQYHLTDRNLVIVSLHREREEYGTPSISRMSVCEYDLNTLERNFQQTWDLCQDRRGTQKKRDQFSIESHPNGHFCTELSDNKALGRCFAPYGAYGRQFSASAFKLENYRSFNASAQMELPKNVIGHITSKDISEKRFDLIPLENPLESGLTERNSYLILLNDGIVRRFTLDRNAAEKDKKNRASNQIFRWDALSFSSGSPLVSIGNYIFEGAGNQLERMNVSCANLYDKKCPLTDDRRSEQLKHLFTEELGCTWCTREDGRGEPMHYSKCDATRLTSVTGYCPPIMTDARFINDTTIEFSINNGDIITRRNMTACGEPCILDKHNSYSDNIQCNLKESINKLAEKHDGFCKLHFEALVSRKNDGKPDRYVFVKTRETPGEARSIQSAAGGMAKWIIVVLVGMAVFGILLVCFVLYWRRQSVERKREGFHQHEDGNSSIAPLPMDHVQHNRRPGVHDNEYDIRVNPMDRYLTPNDVQPPPPYEDMSYLIPDKLKIDYTQIDLVKEIGRGHFGIVYKAKYVNDDDKSMDVAVKTLQGGISGVREFLQEGIRMENFDHERVMSLTGISFSPDNYPMIVTQFMAQGDLLTYLQDPKNTPSLRQLLQFNIQMAEGMQYLHKLKFIHRDLAARNCMLDDDLRLKIADFGLSRDVYENGSYYAKNRDRDIPIRWMAIEGIERLQYTFKGDIWAYGITCWEVMTRGSTPYSGLAGYHLLTFLKSGERLPRPEFCPSSLYSIMMDCWALDPSARPDFADLVITVPRVVKELEEQSSAQTVPVNQHSYENFLPGDGNVV